MTSCLSLVKQINLISRLKETHLFCLELKETENYDHVSVDAADR